MSQSPDAYRAELRELWNRSYLGQFPADVGEDMMSDAFSLTVPAGTTIIPPYGPSRMTLLHAGRARVQASSADGRAVTIRYVDPGQVIGLPVIASGTTPVGAMALTDCTVSILNSQKLQQYIATRPEVGAVLLRESTRLLYEAIELLTENLFTPVKQRVCRHLLDMAVQTPEGSVVMSDHRSIAEAIGSVREVVARSIRGLQAEGIVAREGHHLVIVDAERLASYSEGEGRGPREHAEGFTHLHSSSQGNYGCHQRSSKRRMFRSSSLRRTSVRVT